MKRLKTIALILLGLMLVIPAHAATRNLVVKTADAQQQKRVALVIGNSDYQGVPSLKNPVNDAKAMAEALNKLGFEVIEVTNASQREMNKAIASFGEKLTSDSAALFFYAGHGLQVRGKNYLVPVDAQIDSEASVSAETVNVDTVLDQLASSTVSIVILDACRNNPFEHAFRKMGGGLAQMDAPKGSFIAYATAPGKTAADGTGNHGLFTQELLKEINEPGLELGMLMRRVRSNVARATADQQMPWDSSSMTGEFYFKPGKDSQVASLEPVAAPVHVKTREEVEQETWESARDSNNIDAVKEYIKQYPHGRFVPQAKVLIATLKKSPVPATQATEPAAPTTRADNESDLWAEAQKGNSKEDYQAYLDQYPKGKYGALAKSRMKKLQDEAQAALDKQEQDSWQAAQDENSEESYGRYLKGYSNGRYAGLAKARQEKLKNDQAAKDEAELWKKADSSNDKALVESYLNKYPSGRYVAAASAKLKTIKEEEAKGPVMVRIPGRNYEMGKYDVTQGEWKAVMGSNPSHFSSCGDNCPVEEVSWDDIQTFLQKLNAKTGRQYRLPTETEWEYACYGGSQTEYCGGNDIDSVAWYGNYGQPGGNSGQTTHPVGQKQANGYGLYDMSGNVWQWMENKYDNEHDERALRGGSWLNGPRIERAASRSWFGPAFRTFYYGFRLARTLP